MTPTDEYTTRYTRVEREKDAFGRLIGVRRLKPSEGDRILEFTPKLTGDNELTVLDEETGQPTTIKLSHRFNLTMAASVCEIDGQNIPFPRSRGELDAILDRLDKEGIEAAIAAFARLTPKKQENGDEEADGTIDAEKK